MLEQNSHEKVYVTFQRFRRLYIPVLQPIEGKGEASIQKNG